ncbi:DEAD/DEAH box helicase family protein [Cryptosporidium muris RN66]|uniref:DEAD/DEAH box helicase family protein n=1 Tax=Cryptosporidium muris (strain RN66) TaxID=441375 RepID=B6A991_CRYMR|nr:DEAD/DEAH box helicase family protein [Cryptosporidium muris RN66]EEA04782.1 DEAD/DEAH box helicase family protein [Cryptosporidium muris RN66]|eukprot:XP_002139131.1 DEAD/DEAH box helicase family protein [Cryptosporidium muris RN66]
MFAGQEDFWTSEEDEGDYSSVDLNSLDDEDEDAKDIASMLCETVLSEEDTKLTINIDRCDDLSTDLPKEVHDIEPDICLKKEPSKMIRKRWSIEDTSDTSKFIEIIGYNPYIDDSDSICNIDQSNIILKYPFKLDHFQKRAIIRIHQGDHVLIAAHTSAGKTAIAEYAIELSNKNGKKTIYTSPIKALSSQKYREFQNRFRNYPSHPTITQRNRVGIITGDISMNPDAQCVIMTTEILRTMLYRNDPYIDQLQTVIFDEVHYINDLDRGVVWEEVLILLPPRIQLVLLSATIPNYLEFANWLGRIRQNTVYCIRTLHRPVPLKHYLYIYEKCFLIMDNNNKFNISGYKEMLDHIKSVKQKGKNITSRQNKALIKKQGLPKEQETKHQENTFPHKNQDDVNSLSLCNNATNNKKLEDSHELNNEIEGEVIDKISIIDKDSSNSDKNSNILINNSTNASTSLNIHSISTNSSYSTETKFKTEVYRLQIFLRLLEKNDQLPVIIFGFSRRKVEQLASSIPNLDFIANHNEKSNVVVFIKDSLEKLRDEDKQIPQLLKCRELALRGVGIHHSGMLPIVKEMTEIYFQEDLLKKYRLLHSSEYTQMAGRAGRRGIDTFGNVFIFNSSYETIPECIDIVKMMLNTYIPVQSHFRLTYQMLLQLSCRHSVTIEDMMVKSFKEMFRAIHFPIFQKNLKRKLREKEVIEKQVHELLSTSFIKDIPSDIPNFSSDPTLTSSSYLASIEQLVTVIEDMIEISSKLYPNLLNTSINKNTVLQKIFNPGRLVLLDMYSIAKTLPLFCIILDYNDGNYKNQNITLDKTKCSMEGIQKGSFRILLLSEEEVKFLDITNTKEYQNSNTLINSEITDTNHSTSNFAGDSTKYYDVVEQSIEMYKGTEKKKQIQIVEELINNDRRNKQVSGKTLPLCDSQYVTSSSIKVIHKGILESDILPVNPLNLSKGNVETCKNSFSNLRYYLVLENVVAEHFLLIFEEEISNINFRNINLKDISVIHQIAISCRNELAKKVQGDIVGNTFKNSSTTKPRNRNKQIKVNLNEFIRNSIQSEDKKSIDGEYSDPFPSLNTNIHGISKKNSKSNIIDNSNISTYNYNQLTTNNNEQININKWPKLFIYSKQLKYIEMEFYELLHNQSSLYNSYISNICHEYPILHKHIYYIQRLKNIDRDIQIYKHFMDNESLDDYEEMKLKLNLLIEKGFLDTNHTITTKGRIATEILTSDELTLVEILLSGVLHKLDTAEIAAILSCFVFPEKLDDNNGKDRPSLPTAELLNAHNELFSIHREYENFHYKFGINLDTENYWSLCNDGLMFIAYKWAKQESLKDIMDIINSSGINLHEGTIVRSILRLDELIRKLLQAVNIMGDNILKDKLEQVHNAIARDIIFMTSLYLSK